MRLAQHLLPQLVHERVFLGRADRREMTLHALERALFGRGLGCFPADLVGDDDLVIAAVELHRRGRCESGRARLQGRAAQCKT